MELFQHLFIALVYLHTRQSAKPELNGISGGIYNRQNCGGFDVEPKTVSISDFFFLNLGVLTLRSKIWELFSFGDLVNSNCIISFFRIFLFYLLLPWYTRYGKVKGKTGKWEAIKPNLRKKSKIGRKSGMGFSNRTMIFKNFTAVFTVNILCNEYILISVMWNWMCLDTRTAALGSGGWRSLFKYLYREEDKARNCYENSSLHVSKDRLTVQGFTRTTPWRYLNNRLTLWGAVRGVCISKPKEKISFSSKSFRRHF